MNPGQQAVRDNRISKRNTEHRQAFYPTDEVFTDSAAVGQQWDQEVTGLLWWVLYPVMIFMEAFLFV